MKFDLRAFLFIPVLIGAGSAADELYYQPEAATELARTFSITAEATIKNIDLRQFGEAVDPSEMGEQFGIESLEGSVESEGSFEDSIVRSERGRVLELVRAFGEFKTNGEVDEDDEDAPKSVRFVWNEERDAYDCVVLDPTEPTAEQQERAKVLRADVDHVHLLPPGPVEVGDTWEVDMDLDRLMAAVMPLEFGEASLEKAFADAEEEDDGSGDAVMKAIFEAIGEAVDDTKAKMTYTGTAVDETTGRSVAVGTMALEFEFEIDLGPIFKDMISAEAREGERTPEMSVELVLKASLAGEGEFAWDAQGHHLQHLVLPLEFEIGVEGRMAIELIEGEEIEFVGGTIDWTGKLNLEQHTVRS